MLRGKSNVFRRKENVGNFLVICSLTIQSIVILNAFVRDCIFIRAVCKALETVLFIPEMDTKLVL